jgi:Kef-type K+ transport system membrane component KefB
VVAVEIAAVRVAGTTAVEDVRVVVVAAVAAAETSAAIVRASTTIAPSIQIARRLLRAVRKTDSKRGPMAKAVSAVVDVVGVVVVETRWGCRRTGSSSTARRRRTMTAVVASRATSR